MEGSCTGALLTLAALALVLAVGPASAANRAGEKFRDCANCPEMVIVPTGSFDMGTLAEDGRSFGYERPVHEVKIARAFAVGVTEVTFAQWDACVDAGSCAAYTPPDNGLGREAQPAINVSWTDARAYVRWLTSRTGRRYRLPTEAEWEYAARAGSTAAYAWGDDIGTGRANCLDCGSPWDKRQPAPAGSFPANAWGIHDMHGNVWEWTQDCWHDTYRNAPTDGSAWELRGERVCELRVLRGGSWYSRPGSLRSATRYASAPNRRYFNTGFRVARSL